MSNMSNTQFFILLGTMLAGVIWQRVDAARTDRILEKMGEFNRELGVHGTKIEYLSKKL